MNLNEPRHPWNRLIAAARRAPDAREAGAPYGFATRVAALAGSSERATSLFELFALRAVAVSSLLAIASVALSYSALTAPAKPVPATHEEEVVPLDDAVSVVLGLTD